MPDEAHQLSETLLFTAAVIVQASPNEKVTISSAYNKGKQLIAALASEGTSQRPGIEACILQHRKTKQAEDIACAGWMLAAISARVDEQDLQSWEELKTAIDGVVDLLTRDRASRIH
ncbi:hypothetical protein CFBP4996_26155 (plasmid) [Agrobacterium leguminum]|uniref:hypothetical protein n=1 Tax=Agrobacterium leguminum TaxID=2792015 RepID=UPI0010C95450|nr:hypothetical protein [Agrobacterium leguminum]WFS69559.1 hypothetical protein CFBP4996_26155 [Agrobacterium leguminum]